MRDCGSHHIQPGQVVPANLGGTSQSRSHMGMACVTVVVTTYSQAGYEVRAGACTLSNAMTTNHATIVIIIATAAEAQQEG